MWNVIIGCAVTIIASWLFSIPATRQMKLTTRVLAGYLEGTIKGQDITFNRDKQGNPVGLNITAHTEPIVMHSKVSGTGSLVPPEDKAPTVEGNK